MSSPSSDAEISRQLRTFLTKIQDAETKRDQELREVHHIMANSSTLDVAGGYIYDVQRRQLISSKEQAAVLASSLQRSAQRAETSSKTVKQLDVIHTRVKEALALTQSLRRQRDSVGSIHAALEHHDYTKATECVLAFEEVSNRLKGASAKFEIDEQQQFREDEQEGWDVVRGAAGAGGEGGSAEHGGDNSATGDDAHREGSLDHSGQDQISANSFSTNDSTPASDLHHQRAKKGSQKKGKDSDEATMAAARATLHQAILDSLDKGAQERDSQAMMHFSVLLSRLGYSAEACTRYSNFVTQKTLHDINALVDTELEKVSSGASQKSHLILVSEVLDHVVVTIEKEEDHMKTHFGGPGLSKMLLELHNTCTQCCVRVLKDFLQKRQLGQKSSKHKDPRILDQTLEDISHLVSCCHLYMSFIDTKYTAHADAQELAAAAAAAVSSNGTKAASYRPGRDRRKQLQYTHFVTENNPLFDMIQDLFAIYVPMLQEYFDAAFHQAVILEQANDAQAVQAAQAAAAAANSGNTPQSPSTGIMSTLTSLYSVGTASGGTPVQSSHAQPGVMISATSDASGKTLPVREVNLVDDTFYFLRVALHRTVSTKSCMIASAAIIAINDLVKDKLHGEVQKRLSPIIGSGSRRGGAGGAGGGGDVVNPFGAQGPTLINPRVLKWLNAGKKVPLFMTKLASELDTLARANFEGDDLIRLEEQRLDYLQTSKFTSDAFDRWLHQLAALSAQQMLSLKCGVPEFSQINYVMGDQQFGRYDLSDPWAQQTISAWHAALIPFKTHLSPSVYDMFVVHVVNRVVTGIEEVASKKNYDAYGALQLDKDVRAIKQFFMESTEEVVRDKFYRLTAMCSVLLVDRISEVAEVFASLPSPPVATGASGGHPHHGQQQAVVSESDVKGWLLLKSGVSREQVAALKL